MTKLVPWEPPTDLEYVHCNVVMCFFLYYCFLNFASRTSSGLFKLSDAKFFQFTDFWLLSFYLCRLFDDLCHPRFFSMFFPLDG